MCLENYLHVDKLPKCKYIQKEFSTVFQDIGKQKNEYSRLIEEEKKEEENNINYNELLLDTILKRAMKDDNEIRVFNDVYLEILLQDIRQEKNKDNLKNEFKNYLVNEKKVLETLNKCEPNPDVYNNDSRIKWAIKGYSIGNNRMLEDWFPSISEKFKLYDENKKILKEINFNILDGFVGLNKLEKVLKVLDKDIPYKDFKEEKYRHTKLEYSDNNIQVIVPKTKESAIYWGWRTNWCTSSNDSFNRFDSYYNEENPFFYLYIIIWKQEGIDPLINFHRLQRAQIHFASSQFMNEKDEEFMVFEQDKNILFNFFNWLEETTNLGIVITSTIPILLHLWTFKTPI